jgi:hypothetical protein
MAASGLSPSEFAARRGLDVQRLYRWRRRLAASPAGELQAEPAVAGFIELSGGVPQAWVIEVVVRSERVLRAPAGIDPEVLLRLVEALER